MSSHKKTRKSQKGRESTGLAGAIDENVCNQEAVNSDVQSEIESLKKENIILKKENKTIKEDYEKLKNENQELMSSKMETLRENNQLKQEIEKLEKVVVTHGSVDNGTPQNREMEIEKDSCGQGTYGVQQSMLKTTAYQQSASVGTSGDGYYQKASMNSAMYVESSGVVNEDIEPREEVDWNASGSAMQELDWNESATEETEKQKYNTNYNSRKVYSSNQRCGDSQQKQKRGWNKQRNTTHDNEGGSNKQYGWRDYKQYEGGNKYKYDHENHDNGRSNDRQFRNRQREEYQQGFDKNRKQHSLVKIVETNGDLFSAPEDHSLAHCVAADLRMGSGIAVQFKQQFKNVGELAGQRKRVGQVAVLEEKGRFIYYLITKKFSTGKPRLEDLKDSIEDMKKHVEKYEVKNIAIPRLGCGLDRLTWRDVRQLLQEIFSDVDVTITVYNFTVEMQNSSDYPTKKSSLYIKEHLMRLVNIERGTLLLAFGSECGYVDETMQELDEKFRFINDYKTLPKKLGEVLELNKQGEIICILIVKRHKNELLSYPDLEQCFINLRKIFRKSYLGYMGLQAFIDGDDDLTVAKIITLLKMVFAHIDCETWICWPDELKRVYEDYHDTKERGIF